MFLQSVESEKPECAAFAGGGKLGLRRENRAVAVGNEGNGLGRGFAGGLGGLRSVRWGRILG